PSLVFGLHPLRVEPVAWVAARGTVLGGLFLVLATHVYVLAASRAARGQMVRPATLARVAGLFVLALLSRATGLVLPAVLTVLDVYPLRRLGGESGWLGKEARAVWAEKAILCGLGLLAIPRGLLARADSGDPP